MVEAIELMVSRLNAMNVDYFNDEELTTDEIAEVSGVVIQWVKAFNSIPEQYKFGYSNEWSKLRNGREIGLSYVFGYASLLLVELIKKRYNSNTRDMSAVMKKTHSIVRNKKESLSVAMKLAYQKVRERNTLVKETITEECDFMIESIGLKLYDGLSQRYESLRQVNGKKWSYCNKNTAMLAFQFVKYFVSVIKY